MDWLRPGLLWGLMGAALPLLIHLMGKKRRRSVQIATLRFLERAKARTSASFKLKQLLLLLMRMLALACVALLFAGPGRVAVSGAEARTIAVVVDTSPSMAAARNGHSRLDEAKRAIGNLLDEASQTDSFAILTTEKGSSTRMESFVGREEAKSRLEKIGIGAVDAGLGATLDLAAALLKVRGGSTVLLATDMQKSAWSHGAGAGILDVDLTILVVGFPDPKNAWISDLDFPGGAVRVKSASMGVLGGRFTVSLELDGGRKFTSFVDKGAEVEFRPSPTSEPTTLKAVVEPGGDLAQDDTVVLASTSTGAIRVLLVNGDPKGNELQDELHFVRNALSSGGKFEKNFTFREVRQSDFILPQAAGVDVLLLANPGPVSPEAAKGLLRLVGEGMGLIIAAGDRWSPERADDALSFLAAAPLRDRMQVPTGDPSRPPFEEVDNASLKPPFASIMAETARSQTRAKVTSFWTVDTSAERGSRVLMRLGNQIPLLTERQVGRGRLMLFATSLDRDWSDWCLKPEFVPFLEKLLSHGAGRTGGQLKPLVGIGEKIASPFAEPVELKAPGTLEVQWLPDEEVEAKFQGFYKVSRAGRLVGGFFVRPDPTESDLTRLTGEELKKTADGLGATLLPSLKGGRTRSDLTWLAAAVLLGALAVEAILSARFRKKARKPVDEQEKGRSPR